MTGNLTNAIYPYLNSVSAITNICSSRIYPLKLPQKAELPAITFAVIDENREMSLSGPTDLAWSQVEIFCFAADIGQSRNLADKVRAAMHGYVGMMGGIQVNGVHFETQYDAWNPEVLEVKTVLIFNAWHR